MKKISILIICVLTLISCSLPDIECYCCGKYIMSDEAKSIDTEFFCKNCYYHSKECDHCHEKYLHENDESDFNYCYSCIYDENVVFQCVECGLYKTIDEKYVNADMGNLCAVCTIYYLVDEINKLP